MAETEAARPAAQTLRDTKAEREAQLSARRAALAGRLPWLRPEPLPAPASPLPQKCSRGGTMFF